jgi:hypothetical protein
LISPVWSASNPKSRSRSAAMAAMDEAPSCGQVSALPGPCVGSLRQPRIPHRLDYLVQNQPTQRGTCAIQRFGRAVGLVGFPVAIS